MCLPTGSAQFQSCHNATGCGGNVVNVSNARDCCLGSGFSFHDGGTCRECIGKQLHQRCIKPPRGHATLPSLYIHGIVLSVSKNNGSS